MGWVGLSAAADDSGGGSGGGNGRHGVEWTIVV